MTGPVPPRADGGSSTLAGEPPRRIPELLAPAGNPQKLRTALHFGADAVYLGLKRYSLRGQVGNFDADQLRWALEHAHQRGRRVYVCLNIQPFDSDLDGIVRALELLRRLPPDGVIVADPGVLALARRHAPGLPLHLSTQASVTNAAAARFWAEQGVERIILARELSLEQLRQVVQDAGPEVQLEAFIHGAVCIAWSGRCLLSLYWAGRDPRRGHCAQGCRWAYRSPCQQDPAPAAQQQTGDELLRVCLEDRRRPGEANPVEQDQRGTYFFDAKDLCAVAMLDRLVDAGVASFKLEGRTRSVNYLGATVDVYRHALDRLAAGDAAGFTSAVPAYVHELSRVSSRGFSTHFLGGEQDRPESYLPAGSYHQGITPEYLGRVVRALPEGLVVQLQNPLQPGQRLELRDRGLSCEPCTPRKLLAPDGAPLAEARAGDQVLLPGSFKAGPQAVVRLAAGACISHQHRSEVCESEAD